ncbi:MAG: ABC transporter ATP-binding protein [Clostridium sp.]|jgi:simple sugar transport system ATP-binding protein|nr:ABC transporter ATP-binding protein [Clostridium sp.]
MSERIVEMRHITKRFPGVVANQDISLEIKKGEVFAVIGENGAGKSTLISMLFGMYEPDGGEILIRGVPEKIFSPARAVELDIGMVHQHFKLVENYTVTENIILGAEPIRRFLGVFPPYVDRKGSDEKIAELSGRYGLEVRPRRLVENLKVSERQRVEILKMLYRNAEILIFDEPTAMLTPQEIENFLRVIKNLRDGGKTVILVTHKFEEIRRTADRCAVLRQGRLAGVLDVAGSEGAVRTAARMMVGRDVALEVEKSPANFGETVLSVEGLTVEDTVDQFESVKNVSFKIRSGEIFAVAGVSGNGQVEIADAIAGLAEVKTGRILLNGEEITRSSPRGRQEKGIAYIPEDRQSVGLILDFTLSENLALKKYREAPFSKGFTLDENVFAAYAGRLIETYDIRSGNEGGLAIMRGMSGGNQQKAIIAREIESGAGLILFVQPTRGLDIGAIASIRRRMLAERDSGKAILLISYDLDEILACADTVGVICGGEMLLVSAAEGLSAAEIGAYMMGVTAK